MTSKAAPIDAAQEAQWIVGIRQGDHAAFAALVRAYYPPLFDFAYSYTRSTAAAEDLVQDVLVNVWENRTDWQPYGSARAYLFRAVRNRALNHLRDTNARRTADLAPAEDLTDPTPAPDDDLRYRELVAAYQAAVEAIPERRRLVFRLSRLYGLTYEEIAAVMGISINTVRTQMTAALQHLRERLG